MLSQDSLALYLLILLAAVALTGLILHRRWQSRRALVARVADLSRLADIGRAIIDAPLDLARLTEIVYQQAGQIVDTSIFQMGLFQEDRYRLLIWVVDGHPQPTREFRLTTNSLGIVGWLRESRRSLLVRDFEAERESLPAQPRYISNDPPRSAVFVPLLVGEIVLGAIAIQSRRARAFDEEHLRLLSIVATHAAAALDKARVYEQAQQRAAHLQVLAEVTKQINVLQPLPALYKQIVESVAARLADYELSFYSKSGDWLRLQATTALTSESKTVTLPVADPDHVAAWAATERKAIVRESLPELESRDDPRGDRRAEMGIPVVIEDRVLGVLHIQSRTSGIFEANEKVLFESLAGQIAFAILESELYAAVQRRAEQLTTIAQVTRTIVSMIEVSELFDEVLDRVEDSFGYKRAHIFLAQAGQLVFRAGIGKGATRWQVRGYARDLNGPGLVALAGRTRQGVLVRDTGTHPEYAVAVGLEDTRSEMVVPMQMGESLIGVIDVQSEKPNYFGEDDLQTLQTLADALAVAVRNARLFEIERRRRHLAETLREVSAALTSTLNLDDVLDLILNGLARVVTYDAASILLVNDSHELILRAARGGPALEAMIGETLDVHLFPGADETVGEATPLPTTVNFGEVDRSNAYHDLVALPDPHACLGAVLALRGEHIGYLTVDRVGAAQFPQGEVELVSAFASQAAIAIDNARLYTAQQEEAWVSAALLQVAEAVAQPQMLDEGLESVVRLTPMLVGLDRVIIYRWDVSAQLFHAGQLSGFKKDNAALIKRTPWTAADFEIDPATNVTLPAFQLKLTDSQIALFECTRAMVWPLWARGDLLGVLLVEFVPLQVLGRRLSILDGIAHQLSLAMDNARLEREVALQHKLERDVEMARDIQASFLPESCPWVAGWEIGAFWQAARQVGGDFYDFIRLRPTDTGGERWGIIIADVADKGMAAALFMAIARTLMRTVAINHIAPAVTMSRVNELVNADAKTDLYVTIFYAVWEPGSGRLTYVNAGHNPPILAGPNAEPGVLVGRGAPIGVFDVFDYHEHEIFIQPGEVLVFYTDGLPDAIDTGEKEFGIERMQQVVAAHHTRTATEILDAVAGAVLAHVGVAEPFDDMTMVVLKRKP